MKCIFRSSAPVHFWAPARSRIVDLTSQDFSLGSGKMAFGDVAYPSKKSTIAINVSELSVKALE
jgi:hypothetical protein